MVDAAFRTLFADAIREAVAPLAQEVAELRRVLDARLPEPWVSRGEAARLLGCSTDTVDRQVASGALPSQRIGKRGVRVRVPARPEAPEIARLAREARGL